MTPKTTDDGYAAWLDEVRTLFARTLVVLELNGEYDKVLHLARNFPPAL